MGEFNFEPTLHVPARHYFDLAATYTLLNRVNLRAGVNNIFDKDPPLFTTGGSVSEGSNLCPTASCSNNTYPGVWDTLGRLVLGRCDDRLHAEPFGTASPAAASAATAAASAASGDADLRRWLGDPGDGRLPGTAAAAATAGAGSGTRPLRKRKTVQIGAAGLGPAALFFAGPTASVASAFALKQRS